MAEAERRLLAGKTDGTGFGQHFREQGELGLLAAFHQGELELQLTVEVVLDHALIAAGHKDHMVDAGLLGFVHHRLDQRPVDHGQHFLRHGLGSWQEAGSQTGDWENGFTDTGHAEFAVILGMLINYLSRHKACRLSWLAVSKRLAGGGQNWPRSATRAVFAALAMLASRPRAVGCP